MGSRSMAIRKNCTWATRVTLRVRVPGVDPGRTKVRTEIRETCYTPTSVSRRLPASARHGLQGLFDVRLPRSACHATSLWDYRPRSVDVVSVQRRLRGSEQLSARE